MVVSLERMVSASRSSTPASRFPKERQVEAQGLEHGVVPAYFGLEAPHIVA